MFKKKNYSESIVEWNFFSFFEAERNHRNVIVGRLVDFDRTVEDGQLLFEQLQIGIDKTQLEGYCFA